MKITFIVKYHFMNVFETFDLYVAIHCDLFETQFEIDSPKPEKFNCLSLYCAPYL